MASKAFYIQKLGGAENVANLISDACTPRQRSSNGQSVKIGQAGWYPLLPVESWNIEVLRELFLLKSRLGQQALRYCSEAVSTAVGLRQSTQSALNKEVAEALPDDIANGAAILSGNLNHCRIKLV